MAARPSEPSLPVRPDSTLTIENGRLRVVQPAPPRDLRRPIDTFFRSLAEDQGENAIAVVLAGWRRPS